MIDADVDFLTFIIDNMVSEGKSLIEAGDFKAIAIEVVARNCNDLAVIGHFIHGIKSYGEVDFDWTRNVEDDSYTYELLIYLPYMDYKKKGKQ